ELRVSLFKISGSSEEEIRQKVKKEYEFQIQNKINDDIKNFTENLEFQKEDVVENLISDLTYQAVVDYNAESTNAKIYFEGPREMSRFLGEDNPLTTKLAELTDVKIELNEERMEINVNSLDPIRREVAAIV